MTWFSNPTYNGIISILGWYIQTDNDVSLTSATPITASEAGFHSHYVINVSNISGSPFTIRITGTSINESSGVMTTGDTEDLNITASGYYQTSKSWINDVQFSIVESGKSCDLDIYRITYWDRGNNDFILSGSRIEFKPNSSTWKMHIKIYKVNNDGSYNLVDNTDMNNTSFPLRADRDLVGKYKRGDYNTSISGTENEGIIIEVDQTGIEFFYLEIKLN